LKAHFISRSTGALHSGQRGFVPEQSHSISGPRQPQEGFGHQVGTSERSGLSEQSGFLILIN